MPPVVIRTDASAEIGFGHLSRCMSLGAALRSCGADVTFAIRAPSPAVAERLHRHGFGCEAMDGFFAPGSDDDAAATETLVGRLGSAPSLVVDHYAIGQRWEERMRRTVRKLAVIDDLADRQHECDLLVDQNRMFDGEEAYHGLVPEQCRLLVGPAFAMLRPEFGEWRTKPRARDGRIRRLAICFGGSDPHGHTQATLAALAPFLGRIDHVDVVIGPLNPACHEIARITEVDREAADRIALHVDPPDVARLLHAADLAIGGGGVMSWERACLSLPALAVGIVPNQFRNVSDLMRAGVALGEPGMTEPDVDRLARLLEITLDSPDLVRGMSERAGRLVDGDGAARVARSLVAGALSFRPAGPEDSMLIHGWRNHPATRAVSADDSVIPLVSHQRWYEASLKDRNRIMLVAESEGDPVGVARFDLTGNTATISVFKNPASSAPVDLVSQASRWLFDNRSDVDEIKAVVLAGNERSQRAFKRAGYSLSASCYRLRRPHSRTDR